MNRLLAALPEEELQLWLPWLEPITLPLGQVLCEPGRAPQYAYFPITAVASLLYLGADGDCGEVAVVGSDGVVGVSVFIEGQSSPGTAVVQSAGLALRMPARRISAEFERSVQVRRVLLRFVLALYAQVAQTSVCNRRHSITQRLCRRLLQQVDRQAGRELVMTQEQLASLLGVRRESITMEAHKLQQAGCISYSRGHIFVLDRSALERHACECHTSVQREYQRLLPALSPPPCRPRDAATPRVGRPSAAALEAA